MNPFSSWVGFSSFSCQAGGREGYFIRQDRKKEREGVLDFTLHRHNTHYVRLISFGFKEDTVLERERWEREKRKEFFFFRFSFAKLF
jgi:hypothetical protein